MIIPGNRGVHQRPGRSRLRKPKGRNVFWAEGPGLWRLEERTLLSLTLTSFPIPLVALVQPQAIAQGPDGNLWFTENGADRIGRMTPQGDLTEFALPTVSIDGISPQPLSTANAITSGSDGALWFTGPLGEVGRITTSGVVTEFPVPLIQPPAGSAPGTAGAPATLDDITMGPGGALWFTGVPGEVGRITTSGVVTEFSVPAIPSPAGSAPGTASTPATLNDITTGPDGALWFTGGLGEVGRITTAGVVTEFAVPAIPPPAGSKPGTAGTPATLQAITTGPDGALWFTGVPGEVGRITTSGVVTEFAVPAIPPPAGSAPGTASTSATLNDITTGPDGALWFTGVPGEVGRITTAGVVTEFSVPGNFQAVAGLTSGPDGNLWFTESEDGSTLFPASYTPGEHPAVGEITPAGVTTLHAIPLRTTLDPNFGVPVNAASITTGPDGALWFTEASGIGRITTTGTIQQFPLNTPDLTAGTITAGPDGALWFTLMGSDYAGDVISSIGRITTAGAISVYPLPVGNSVRDITSGPDGSVWFTEDLFDYATQYGEASIARITPQGQITTFAIPHGKNAQVVSVGSIASGPDGDLWFTGDIATQSSQDNSFIGRITARGRIRLLELPSTWSTRASSPIGSYSENVSSLISGGEGKLYFAAEVDKESGIAEISTDGKLGSFVPANLYGSLTAGPNGEIWFPGSGLTSGAGSSLAIATRSGIVATQNLPVESSFGYGDYSGMTRGPDGALWFTNGTSSIMQASGLDTPAGGLDYRHRPRKAPDYVPDPYGSSADQWTNVTASAQPTFAGVARPGAEVTLWVQEQGQAQPTSIGQVRASHKDGSWTLKTNHRLNDGTYAVTATQSGDSSPPSVLYSLTPDDSGNLSNALVIDTSRATKAEVVQNSRHASGSALSPRGDLAVQHATARSRSARRSTST